MTPCPTVSDGDELAPAVFVVCDFHAGHEGQSLSDGVASISVLLLRGHLDDAAAGDFHCFAAFHPAFVLRRGFAEQPIRVAVADHFDVRDVLTSAGHIRVMQCFISHVFGLSLCPNHRVELTGAGLSTSDVIVLSMRSVIRAPVAHAGRWAADGSASELRRIRP